MIPKIFHTIWVGDRPMPEEWIKSWTEKNPEWQMVIWDNKEIFESGKEWVCQKHIDYFRERKIWAGVADCVRYQILYENGGFGAGADSICLEPIDELFQDPAFDAYTSYENEVVTGELVSPMLGCTKGNPLAYALMTLLSLKEEVGVPWQTTGNLFMMHACKALQYPRLKIFPSHYLLPEHHTGVKYEGKDKIYAKHMWGTGKNGYDQLNHQHHE